MMGLPPVVVGLFVYLMLSRSGPLGILELLYTPTAMIIAQVILIIPIIASLTYQVIEELNREYRFIFKLKNRSSTGDLCIPLGRPILAVYNATSRFWSRNF